MMRTMSKKKSVCVFCGASNAIPKKFFEAGHQFGEMLAKHNITLVYGGGDCGVMGAVANAVMENQGHVTGVFPISLRNLENEHKTLSEIIIVNTMHERKQLMFERSDAFIVFPGGFGTMDEMFEIITWKQLRLHEKPVIIYNQDGYWNPLIALMSNIIENQFAKAETYDFYKVVDSLDDIIPALGFTS
jgi:uncharacterized protein (TIGR00730 family)